jgi:hypothetical protein
MSVLEMLKMSQAQLDDLFTKSPAGEIPKGSQRHGNHRAGTTYSETSRPLSHFAWQGKVFDPRKRRAPQQDHSLWPERIIAKVYGESWLDGASASF